MDSNLPAPRYSVWQAINVAVALSLRAIDEIRALARQPGPPGKDGVDAVSPKPDAIAAILKAEIEAPLVQAVHRAIEAIPVPVNGKTGRAGRDGAPGQSIKGDPGSVVEIGESAPARLTAAELDRVRVTEIVMDGLPVRVLTLS